MPDLIKKSGSVAVVTGGSRGIGLHVVRMLLQCDMHVVIGEVQHGLSLYSLLHHFYLV